MKTFNVTIDSNEEKRLDEAKKESHLTYKGIVLDWLEKFEKAKAKKEEEG